MISRWYFDRVRVSSFAHLLECYDRKEFLSPTRSTVPLLSLVKSAALAWQSTLATIGMSGEVAAHFEFCVAPPLGSGLPSHTDIMLVTDTDALAIEAKWTEPRYDTVGQWLQKGRNSQNRREVLQGWLNLLQPFAKRQLEIADMSGAVYQMVHRAASACAVERNPKLAYLQFTPLPNGKSSCGQVAADLAHLYGLMGLPENFRFHLIEMELHPTSDYTPIINLPKGAESTKASVLSALAMTTPFRFTPLNSQLIL